jgi:nucleotide-binding universal stress UspA family protein
LKKIAYATEINDNDFRPLRKLADIANRLESEIEVVHIVVKDSELDRSMFEWYKEMALDRVPYPKMSFHLIENDDVLKSLEAFTRQHQTELLAMSTHRRTLFGRIFGKSLTRKMAYHTHLPLLTFHIPDNADYFFA